MELKHKTDERINPINGLVFYLGHK